MGENLELDEYKRYGRQMILDGIGRDGQLRLKRASAVVVGAGGLGCSALQYLAAAGIGRLGIIDHDVVELSNLQRQILHTESRLGTSKASSAAQALEALNRRVKLDIVTDPLVPSNAVSLLRSYDVILDCTDNAPTRYLLSDAAVFLGKPLVSGAAQKFDGQMCTYNLGAEGPCYRCLFPQPLATEPARTCEETGILGAITGIIGNMQALETIKIITGLHDRRPSLFLFSSLGCPQFRSVKLRKRRATCPACVRGDDAKSFQIESMDYIQLCGGSTPNWECQGLIEDSPARRVKAKELKVIIDSTKDVVVIDVRPRTEFGICRLPGSVSASSAYGTLTAVSVPPDIPLKDLIAEPATHLSDRDTYLICRLGNDSQIAANALRSARPQNVVKDVIGGLRAWAKDVDKNFPVY